jgi:methyl-accepting chemotaxis protein
MKKLSLRSTISLIQLLLVVLPLAVIFVLYLMNMTVSSSAIRIALASALALAVLATVIQNVLFGVFLNGAKKITEKLIKIEQGDLSVIIEESSLRELNGVSSIVAKIISGLNEVLSEVHSSSADVKHMISTVMETFQEWGRNSEDISRATGAVSDGAIHQAEDSEVCHKMSMELVNQVEVVSQSTELMSAKAQLVQNMTESGKKSISELLDQSKLSETNVAEINKSIEGLSSMAQDIAKITEIITAIANQTNLLSLNASIEAARAGEAGKGFAVVAGEIKKLAEKSLESASSIDKTIASVRDQVSSTTEKINSITQTIMYQIGAVHKTTEAFNEISGASEELFSQLHTVLQGISQLDSFKTNLAGSIENISVVAAETAASSEEITSLMYSQNNSANVLMELSSNLETIFGGIESKLTNYVFDKKEKARKSFAVISVLDIPFFKDTFKGAEDIAKKIGVDILSIAPKEWGPKVQAGIIEDCIQKGVDGIALIPIDSPEVREAVKKATGKGIKFVTIENSMNEHGASELIGTDNFSAGLNVGKSIIKSLNGRGKVIISTVSDTFDNMVERMNGIRKAIEKYPNIKIVGIESNHETIDGRVETLKQLIKEHSDLDCIVFIDYQGGEAIEKLLKQVDVDAKIIGFDNSEEAIRMVKSGRLHSIIIQRQKIWGELAIRRLNDLTLGKKVPEFEDAGTYEINKRNISTYIN